ncbi:MAG: dual specificity protein phosphatase family protein [Chloroflexi bacterium]|nr:dual specificity protein phosphatase family protein [Chloroflexota bacterium]
MAEKLSKGIQILYSRITCQGVWTTALWAADHAVRIITGAPLRHLTEITPHLYVGGQYRKRGWCRLAARGITAVVNLRTEFDDSEKGIAPASYLYLPTVDDTPPSLNQLAEGVAFIRREVGRGGAVYIHCGAGVGRAPTLAAAYLVSTGLTPDQAWALIQSRRPFVRPKPEQVEQIEDFLAMIRPEAPACGPASP